MVLPKTLESRDIGIKMEGDNATLQDCTLCETTIPALKLDRRDYHVPVGILTLRMRGDLGILTQGKVNQATVIGIHRSKLDARTVALGTRGSIASHLLNLLLGTDAIALDIDHDVILELKLATQERSNNGLKSFERAPVTSDENSKITTVHIKDELTLLAVILIDGGVGLPK